MSATHACGNCGKPVSGSDLACPYCLVWLAGARCRGCGFVGTEADFPARCCPKCGGPVAGQAAAARGPADPPRPRALADLALGTAALTLAAFVAALIGVPTRASYGEGLKVDPLTADLIVGAVEILLSVLGVLLLAPAAYRLIIRRRDR